MLSISATCSFAPPNFREVITSEVHIIHLWRTGLAVSKQPITPVRPVRIAINRLDTLQKLTGTAPVTRRTPPVTTAEQHRSQIVTRRLTWVINDTPVRNEA